MSQNKNELLDKLENISDMYHKVNRIKYEIACVEVEDNYERKVEVPDFLTDDSSEIERNAWVYCHARPEDDNFLERLAASYDEYAPEEPEMPEVPARDKPSNKAEKARAFGCFPVIILFILILTWFEDYSKTFYVIMALLLVAFTVLAVFQILKGKHDDKKADELAQQKYDNEKKRISDEHDKALLAHAARMEEFGRARDSFVDRARDWRKIYMEHYNEELEIEEKLEADKCAAQEKIVAESLAPACAELVNYNDILSDDYLPVIDELMNLLRSGRASDLKEAINLYEEIEFRERQLQLQREQEEQRREDEERRHREDMYLREQQEKQRRADAERHFREEQRFREQQEQNRQYEEKKRLEEERHRHEQDRKAAEKAAQSRGQRRCVGCASYSRCTIKHTDKAYNCPGFSPR